MARFDIFAARRGITLLDVQADMIESLDTRVVVPLASPGTLQMRELTPRLLLNGEEWVMATHLMFSIPSNRLGRRIANSAEYRDEITRALDLLFTGF